MHVRLKVTPEGLMGVCSRCHAGEGQPIGTHVIQFTIETDEGTDSCGPYCFTCLAIQNPSNPMQMIFQPEAAKLPAGPEPPSNRVRKRSRQQERDIAQDIGGQAQKGSGACSGSKGDVRKPGQYRIEAKLTQSNQYILKLDTLRKIQGECTDLERPALAVEFVERSSGRRKAYWVVLPYDDFVEFVNAPKHNR
jgi:hypothetical protein